MAMTEIIKQLEKEILQQRTDEQQLKNEIAVVTTLEFAERAAEGEPESNDFMQIPDGEQGELPFN